ncbi:MAG TPA: 3'(2'),5'-bisphosphate nucleotidase CysQ [Alphaproteobacteria bacterium]|nr:3'(2'),5'-bisphosphate nucleotidase CysQ [Alphaproteobacteria bacterium]
MSEACNILPVAEHAVALDAAHEAGEIAMSYFGGEFARWDKGGDNPVTEADIAIDNMLRKALGDAFPDHGWLSEETEDNTDRLTQHRTWIVDPIDGTRAFMRGEPHFTICIALVEQARPISAIVFNPASGELYEAVSGGGARLNGQPITPSGQAQIEGARMLGTASFYHSKRWAVPWPDIHIEKRNSIAYRIALVAAGRFDGCLGLSPVNDWDLAAADLIMQEAGGRISRRDGAEFLYNQRSVRHAGFVASGHALHPALIGQLATWRPRASNLASS